MSENGETNLVTITVNGQEIEVPSGYSVLQAALDHGIWIPHFCFHPDIGIDGSCRMCLGELEGGPPKLVPTCTLRAADGMVVRTDTERVRIAVQGVLEFSLVNHPIDCPICDQAGECSLQNYYQEFGLHRSAVPLIDKVHKAKVKDLGKGVVLDAERCVLCGRCTRFLDQITGTGELRLHNRGDHTEITTFNGNGLQTDYSGNLVDVCPVGALTSRDFRFKQRVWFLKPTRSVCAGCATNCSLRIDHADGRIYRFKPRRNSHINASWLCDFGRMSYKEVARDRLTAPLLRDNGKMGAIPWEKALDWTARRIREARENPADILAIATPALVTEELFVFKRFATEILNTPNIDYRVSSTCEDPAVPADELLRRADPYPNSRGAELLGLVPGADGVGVADAAGRKFKLIYVLAAHRLQGDRLEMIKALLESAETVIMHAAQDCELLQLADLVLPVSMWPEKAGTFVNYAGRLQRLEQAVERPGEAESTGHALCLVGEKLDQPLCDSSSAAIFAAMAETVEVFRGIEWQSIGETGVQLPGFAPQVPPASRVSVAPQLVG